jgi:hypothetical protein
MNTERFEKLYNYYKSSFDYYLDGNFILTIPREEIKLWNITLDLIENKFDKDDESIIQCNLFQELHSRYLKYKHEEINKIVTKLNYYKNLYIEHKLMSSSVLKNKTGKLLLNYLDYSTTLINDYPQDKYIITYSSIEKIVNDNYSPNEECIISLNNITIWTNLDEIFKNNNYFFSDLFLINIASFAYYGYTNYEDIENIICINFSIKKYTTLKEYINDNKLDNLLNGYKLSQKLPYPKEIIIIKKNNNKIILTSNMDHCEYNIFDYDSELILDLYIDLKTIKYNEIINLYNEYKKYLIESYIENVD